MAKETATIATMPDLPKPSSTKGLWDEDKQIFDNLWSNKQFSDCRFIELFERPVGSDKKSTTKKNGTGRIVTNMAYFKENPWLESSELAVAGVAHVSDRIATAVLPKGQDLLVPSSGDADACLHTADRFRPSPEQAAAQKGAQRAEVAKNT